MYSPTLGNGNLLHCSWTGSFDNSTIQQLNLIFPRGDGVMIIFDDYVQINPSERLIPFKWRLSYDRERLSTYKLMMDIGSVKNAVLMAHFDNDIHPVFLKSPERVHIGKSYDLKIATHDKAVSVELVEKIPTIEEQPHAKRRELALVYQSLMGPFIEKLNCTLINSLTNLQKKTPSLCKFKFNTQCLPQSSGEMDLGWIVLEAIEDEVKKMDSEIFEDILAKTQAALHNFTINPVLEKEIFKPGFEVLGKKGLENIASAVCKKFLLENSIAPEAQEIIDNHIANIANTFWYMCH